MYRDNNLIVTKRANGELVLIIWNLVMEKGNDFSEDFELELPVNRGIYFMTEQSISEECANPWRTWQQMGRPRFPSKSQIEVLNKSAIPFFESKQLEVKENKLTHSVTLTKNEVRIIEVIPVNDESASYPGLDDSSLDSY
ncbi:Glycosyl hydrolases family 39 [Gracilibacillus ureilyticus]|uniref:Glycosyl hydrolases family 39 n=1 Tax=Gracilibacillus ureilyticus TaxID=531814 RepID=A0A1H9PQ69_9BACI|nr:Glycosyl hydrolases family 39 [Gracilibacillus ureilyticus]